MCLAAASALDALREEVAGLFSARFGCAPKWIAAAPGRVNLIGEHTDYNDGFVMPMAIDRYVVMAAAPSSSEARVVSQDVGETATIRLREISPGPNSWSSYVQGVVAGFLTRGGEVEPFNALIRSSVPLGGGLSSGAALEVATATLLEAMSQVTLKPLEKALLCQKAEHEYAGVPCGIMDQFSSVMCRRDRLMLLDCRTREIEHVPFADPDVTVVVTNSNVRHELANGEYAQRRSQCDQAVRLLEIGSLRDASLDQLDSARPRMADELYRRARHVISENQRTLAAAGALRQNNWPAVGEWMYQSHASLRNDYQVSCDELDQLVDIAQSIGTSGGVIGSRMTGGGFGGCTVSLVHTNCVSDFVRQLSAQYERATGIAPSAFATRPSQGAAILEP